MGNWNVIHNFQTKENWCFKFPVNKSKIPKVIVIELPNYKIKFLMLKVKKETWIQPAISQKY